MYNYRPRNTFAYKPMVKKIPVKVTEVSADDVWAAAALADRINGGRYYKELVQNDDASVKHYTNRLIMIQALANNKDYIITDEDRELGRAARKWHQSNLLFASLKRPLTGFETNLQKAAAVDTSFALEVHRLEIATIASQIRSYRSGLLAEQMTYGSDVSPLSTLGARVDCEIKVVKSVYSKNYGVFFVTAVTTTDQKVVRFSFRSQLDVGQVINIKGRVKAHNTDGTQLNYVKVL